jgi:hypothetical protein
MDAVHVYLPETLVESIDIYDPGLAVELQHQGPGPCGCGSLWKTTKHHYSFADPQL